MKIKVIKYNINSNSHSLRLAVNLHIYIYILFVFLDKNTNRLLTNNLNIYVQVSILSSLRVDTCVKLC